MLSVKVKRFSPNLAHLSKGQNWSGEKNEKEKKRRQIEEDEQVGGAADANTECYYCVITMCNATGRPDLTSVHIILSFHGDVTAGCRRTAVVILIDCTSDCRSQTDE